MPRRSAGLGTALAAGALLVGLSLAGCSSPVLEESPTSTATEPGDTGNTGTGNTGRAVYYPNCTATRAAGAAPVRRGQPGYGQHLDGEGDGVGCE